VLEFERVKIVFSTSDCGLPPHRAERLGLSGSDLSPLFPRLSLRKKSLRGTQRKAIGISELCGGKPRSLSYSLQGSDMFIAMSAHPKISLR